MLIKILTNSFCSLEMFFLKFQPYNFKNRLPDIYEGFVTGTIKRGLVKYLYIIRAIIRGNILKSNLFHRICETNFGLYLFVNYYKSFFFKC